MEPETVASRGPGAARSPEVPLGPRASARGGGKGRTAGESGGGAGGSARAEVLAHAAVALTMVVWGSMVPVLWMLLARWDPYTLSALRYALAVPLLLGALRLREGSLAPPPARRWPVVAALGAIGIAGLASLYTVGLARADPLSAILVQAASPLVSTLVAWAVFRSPLERGMGAALVLSVLGGALVMGPGADGAPGSRSGSPGGGELLLVLGSVCWAWYSAGSQRWLAGWSQLRLTAWTCAAAGLALAAVWGVARALGATRVPVPGLADAALVGWLAVGVTGLGVLLWNVGVGRLGLPVCALYLNGIPLVAVLLGLPLGVVPTGPQLLGGLLVLAGIAQLHLRRLRAGGGDRRSPGGPDPEAQGD